LRYNEPSQEPTLISNPPLKKRRKSNNKISLVSNSEKEKDSCEGYIGLEVEINKGITLYLSIKLSKKNMSEPKLLQWWACKSELLPLISLVAKSALTIPASSAKSENNFSDAGNTITVK